MTNLTYTEVGTKYGSHIREAVEETGIAKIIREDEYLLLIKRPSRLGLLNSVDVFTYPKFEAKLNLTDLSGYDLLYNLLIEDRLKYRRLSIMAIFLMLSLDLMERGRQQMLQIALTDPTSAELSAAIKRTDRDSDEAIEKFFDYMMSYQKVDLDEIDRGEGQVPTGWRRWLRKLNLV